MPSIHVDMPMHINYLAVLACGLLNFVIGGVWYSPVLFSSAWVKAAKLDTRKANRSGMGGMFAGAGASGLIVALCLAYLLQMAHVSSAVQALRLALTCWLGFVVAATAGDYLFLRRGGVMFAINNGIHLVTFTVNALILTAWR